MLGFSAALRGGDEGHEESHQQRVRCESFHDSSSLRFRWGGLDATRDPQGWRAAPGCHLTRGISDARFRSTSIWIRFSSW